MSYDLEKLWKSQCMSSIPVKIEDATISYYPAVAQFNSLMGSLKPQSSGPLYSNTVIDTLAVNAWAVTFGIARRRLGGLWPCPVASLLYQM